MSMNKVRSGRRCAGWIFGLLFICAAGGAVAGEATRTFVGGIGDWFDQNNWFPAGIPLPSDTVLIDSLSSVSLDAPATVFGFNLAGRLAGTAPLTVNGPATWSSGEQIDFGATTVTGSLLVTGPVLLNERTLNNSGTVVVDGAGEIALGGFAAINNFPSGVFEIANDHGISGAGTLSNTGTWRRTSSAGTAVIGAPFLTTGALELMAGRLQFSLGFTQIDGVTRLSGGSIESPPGFSVNIQGGRLTGSGIVAAQVINGGTVSPGARVGTIAVDGSFTQMASGRLAIEISGVNVGEFDRLTVSGHFTANGALDVSVFGGYSPEPGDRFEVLTYASRSGDFSSRSGTVFGGGQGLNEVAGPNSLVLEYAEEDCGDGVDNDGNGQVDCADFKCFGVPECVSPASPTPSGTAPPTSTAVSTPEATSTPPPGGNCVGDCDGDGDVSIAELIRGVNISLGVQPLSTCLVLDVNGSGRVEINELIQAVGNALYGCRPSPASTRELQ